MQTETYMQRENRIKYAKRVARIAKTISLLIIFGIPLVIGFFIGRMTAPTPEPTYSPDPCGLNVVVCEGEVDYQPNSIS